MIDNQTRFGDWIRKTTRKTTPTYQAYCLLKTTNQIHRLPKTIKHDKKEQKITTTKDQKIEKHKKNKFQKKNPRLSNSKTHVEAITEEQTGTRLNPLIYTYSNTELSNPALLTLLDGCNVFSSTGALLACLYLPLASLISISWA